MCGIKSKAKWTVFQAIDPKCRKGRIIEEKKVRKLFKVVDLFLSLSIDCAAFATH